MAWWKASQAVTEFIGWSIMRHFRDIRAAIAREKEIKGWRRAKKTALIESRNPAWEDLAGKFFPCFPAEGKTDPSLRSG
jgi:predicted GIY-YIG superfamily endonuclease